MKETPNNFLQFSTVESLREENIFHFERFINPSNILIFKFNITNYANAINNLSVFLNNDELIRANKFYKKEDRLSFIVCRSFLKLLLAVYTKSLPKNINFSFFKNKKPFLKSHPKVCFNLSHSHQIGLIAIANIPVGIDIEFKNKSYDVLESMSTVFGKNEINYVHNSVKPTETFFKLWTRKEALVKTTGQGIDSNFIDIPCLDGYHHINSTKPLFNKNYNIKNFYITNDYVCAISNETDSLSKPNLILFSLPQEYKLLESLFSISS
ncbi:hypothetical protein PK35_07345 [Tamlana nanhaiensis]|uniref:Uncharacterized protein n=1 Tax=Neotamlana nanhaiensis TaxID=1382798 RepID=A0A0D7W3D7_9FLAO|nr:4'-phosphopantetheinyl transferase superfamily protein [Tamlana nanhaiensis]KJD33640.1 hypothetical protein PK35_07345 [Tamlana nanhaiensis]